VAIHQEKGGDFGLYFYMAGGGWAMSLFRPVKEAVIESL